MPQLSDSEDNNQYQNQTNPKHLKTKAEERDIHGEFEKFRYVFWNKESYANDSAVCMLRKYLRTL